MIVLQVSCTWAIDDIGFWMVPLYFLWSVTSNIFKCMVDVFVYMNKWSFVYVGLYVSEDIRDGLMLSNSSLTHHTNSLFQGYSFFQGGKNVTILFQQKGWKRLITDGK